MIGALLGLVGALCIGAADAIARRTAQRILRPTLILLVLGISTPPIAAALVWARAAEGGPPLWDVAGWDPVGLSFAFWSGAFNFLALALLYAALARGPVALVSPAVSTFTILLVGLNAASGQPISTLQIAAAAVVFFGVAQLSRPERRPAGADAAAGERGADLRVTLALSLAAALAVALRMFWAQEAAVSLGSAETLLLTRLVAAAVAALVAVAAVLGRRTGEAAAAPLWPVGALWILVAAQAALEAAALGAFLAGGEVEGGDRIGAAIGFSAFAAATPLFAWIAYGEAVSPRRLGWIAVVVAGVALAALGAPA